MGRPTDQEIKDIINAPKLEKAYQKSLTSTEEAPMDTPSPLRDKIRGQRGYAKGGSIDGCAQRGKTRGRIC